MSKHDENRSAMLKATDKTVDSYADTFKNNPVFVENKTTFDRYIDKVDALGQGYFVIDAGKSAARRLTTQSLRECVFSISAALYSIAAKQNDHELMDKTRWTASGIRALRIGELQNLAAAIVASAAEHKTDLAAYGFEDSDFTDLDSRVSAYDQLVVSRQSHSAKRETLRKELDALYNEIEMFLRNHFDKFVDSVRFKNPAFYNEYKSSRSIRRYIRHKAAQNPVPSGGSTQPAGTVTTAVGEGTSNPTPPEPANSTATTSH